MQFVGPHGLLEILETACGLGAPPVPHVVRVAAYQAALEAAGPQRFWSRSLEADGWATALMAAGEAGPELARNRDIAALFLFRDGVGLRSVATGAVEKHLA